MADKDPPTHHQAGSQCSYDHPSVTKEEKLMVTQAGQKLDPDLSGDPLAKI